MLDKITLHRGELGFPEKNKAESSHIWIFSSLSHRSAFPGYSWDLPKRGFSCGISSWDWMHHRSQEKVFPSKIHELEAHEAQIVRGSDQLCRCFPSSQLFGGSSSTINDTGSNLASFPPTRTLDVTTAPYFKKLKREKRSPAVSEQAGPGGLPDCFKALKQQSQNCCSGW